MRPVNLIPADERRGENAPLRTGPLAYVVVGALLAALAGVTMLVVTGNQISDREAEVAQLERDDAAAQARVQRLSSYTQFASLAEQRVMTVSSLADSRFDWERVMRELSLVLPSDVWLVKLTASASAASEGSADSGSSSGSGLRSATPGPALEITGCARGQEGVAGFVTALKDIDGVTRVGVQSSQLAEPAGAPGAVASGGDVAASGGNEDCRTREFIAKFELVVAFDAAPVTGSAAAPVTPPAESESESAPASSESSGEGE